MSLAAGKLNEDVAFHEFERAGIPITRTEGKNDFDGYLPDGRSLEVKLDLRSQNTGHALIEFPTLQRGADLYLITLTYNRLFTHEQLYDLYLHGKIPNGGIGQYGYDARLVPTKEMARVGTPTWAFIKALINQSNHEPTTIH